MRNSIIAMVLAFALAPFTANAMNDTSNDAMEFGVDVEMPYILTVAGNSARQRGDTTLGVHGNYHFHPNWSLGLQADFGLESNPGADNAFFLTPGAGYYFMPGNTFNPYVRFDLPILLNNGQDFGFSGGIGVHWNMSEITGVDGLGLKYDFAFNYFTDSEVFSLNIFRIAIAYMWGGSN